MKKLFSALIALSIVASTAITAFAAEVTFKGTTDKANYQPGDTVVVSVETVGDPFAAATLELKFDKTQFTYVKAENKGAGTPSAITPANRANGFSRVVFGATDNIQGTIKIDFTFTVNEGLANGTYNLPFGANGAIKDDWGEELTVTGIEIPVVIGSSKKAAELKEEKKDNKAEKAEGEPYTQGFKVTVIPNDDEVSGVDFTLTTSEGKEKEYKGAAAFQFDPTIKGASSIVLGLNVKGIPATATVDAEFTPVVVAE